MRLIRSFYPALLALAVLALICSQVRVRGDDFADHLAALKARNSAKAVPPAAAKKAPCGCAGDCPCAAGECGSSACPTAAKPRTPRPAAGDGWQWTDEDGGYWWRWKTAPAVPVYYPATYPNGWTYWSTGAAGNIRSAGGFRGVSCGSGG